jgi:hypothetical protein
MQYNLTHEPSTDVAVIAAADQLNAPIYEAERLAPHNGDMLQDARIDDIVRWNSRAQYVAEHEFFDSEVVPHVGVVVAVPVGTQPDGLAHPVPEDRGPVTRALAASCVVCGDAKCANGDYRSFWIASGRTILELNLCGRHSTLYVEWFDAVPKEPTYAAV